MIQATLNKEMIDLLKKLISSRFTSYECAKKYNTTYGNMRINTDKASVELSNIQKTIPFFDIEEDIAVLECFKSDPNTEFKPYCIEPFEQYEVDEIITEIKIVNDIIDVNHGEYKISFDRAVIFKTDKSTLMFSRDIWFSEVINISENEDYDAVYSIDEAVEAWSNDGDNKVDIIRTIKVL